MSKNSPVLRFLLDAGVPDSVGEKLTRGGHQVILHRNVLPEGAPDQIVCTTAMANDAILVAMDGDMRQIAQRFGISHGSTRFARLSIVSLTCNEVQASHRVEQAMSLIEHEWNYSSEKLARRLWIEVGSHTIRSNR